MRKRHFTDAEASDVPAPATGVKIRWLIDEKWGATHFAMRHFEIQPGGSTPLHEHEWEHEVFILTGTGTVVSADGESEFGPADVIFVPGGETHCFKNTGAKPVTMLCLVPLGAGGCR